MGMCYFDELYQHFKSVLASDLPNLPHPIPDDYRRMVNHLIDLMILDLKDYKKLFNQEYQ